MGLFWHRRLGTIGERRRVCQSAETANQRSRKDARSPSSRFSSARLRAVRPLFDAADRQFFQGTQRQIPVLQLSKVRPCAREKGGARALVRRAPSEPRTAPSVF